MIADAHNQSNETIENPSDPAAALRIASLLPSTTDICISLGLQRYVVGITHECDFPAANPSSTNDEDSDAPDSDRSKPSILTVSHIDPKVRTQAEIDAAVKNSLHDGLSLYNLNDASLANARPTVILTQSLCEVCAVAKDEVDEKVACKLPEGQCRVISLEPNSLLDVTDTFVTVAEACGVKERGEQLKRFFWDGEEQVRRATALSVKRPKMLFMEWIDPPFNGGHWIPDMIEQAGCSSAMPWSNSACKSVQLSWKQVYESDPDVVIIACCGFDLERNREDAMGAREMLKPLRAFREERIYASNGNLYFARPGPGLREGTAVMARCAYDGDDEVVSALEGLGFLPKEGEGWVKMVFPDKPEMPTPIPDVEDIFHENENYSKLHDDACQAGKDFYEDPKSGYKVFTELAHKKRGKCCGSGCRHCPFNHVNVKDKTMRIQQPAFLYEGADSGVDAFFASLSAIPPHSEIKVLFFSGGKDSFLAIRKLVKQRLQHGKTHPFHLILLTTFDSTTRIIAHQETPIETVLRQAQHLEIPLLAIPLRRGSGETYLNRIEKGLDAIRQRVPDILRITLVFGDLHLDHIRQWRENELAKYPLEYPLWKTPYHELMDDLEKSKVRVVLSATTKDGVKEGMVFTRGLWQSVVELGMDGLVRMGSFIRWQRYGVFQGTKRSG